MMGLIWDLAVYEKLTHEVVATEASLRESLFGERPAAEALLAFAGDEPGGIRRVFPYVLDVPGAAGHVPARPLRVARPSTPRAGHAVAATGGGDCGGTGGAVGLNGWRWTGIRTRTGSTRTWGRRCCRSGGRSEWLGIRCGGLRRMVRGKRGEKSVRRRGIEESMGLEEILGWL